MLRQVSWQMLLAVVGLAALGTAEEHRSPSPDSSSLHVESAAAEDTVTKSDEGAAPKSYGFELDSNRAVPAWTVRADALLLHRAKPDADPSREDYFGATDAKSFGIDTANGWDVALSRSHVADTEWDVEGIFFALDSSNPSDGSFPPTDMGGWTAAPYDYSASYASGLRNVELNAKRDINDWATFLVGFRYLNLHENLAIHQTMNFQEEFHSNSDSRFSTTNDLFGAQLGMDARLWSHGRFSVAGMLKAGIFNNSATSHGEQQFAFFPPMDAEAASDHTAFVGETSLTANYQIHNSWAVRAGYQLLWIEGVALATDQPEALFAPEPPTVSTAGCPFYHGAFVGLEYSH